MRSEIKIFLTHKKSRLLWNSCDSFCAKLVRIVSTALRSYVEYGDKTILPPALWGNGK